MLPHAPCRQFYIAHLHQQPWVQGNYSGLLVQLSSIYSELRGDSSGVKNEDSAQVCLVCVLCLADDDVEMRICVQYTNRSQPPFLRFTTKSFYDSSTTH